MYYSLEGQIVEKSPTHLILDVRGVSYDILIPVSTFSKLPEAGGLAKVLTHFVVREDGHFLFGFATLAERDLFRMLISVSGIGPKVGITVLSGIRLEELKAAIVNGSVGVLTAIPGIGKKTAERMIVELKEKIVIEGPVRSVSGPSAAALTADQQSVEDALMALVSLGYKKNQAKDALDKAVKESKDPDYAVEDLIRASLKNL